MKLLIYTIDKNSDERGRLKKIDSNYLLRKKLKNLMNP